MWSAVNNTCARETLTAHQKSAFRCAPNAGGETTPEPCGESSGRGRTACGRCGPTLAGCDDDPADRYLARAAVAAEPRPRAATPIHGGQGARARQRACGPV